MSFIEGILLWIAQKILNYYLDKATAAVEEAAAKVKRDAERNETNETNSTAYEAADDRAEQIKRATDLLNRVRRPAAVPDPNAN